MTRLDRYILQQLVAAVGFFVLVFTGVIWLTQAVRLIDVVVATLKVVPCDTLITPFAVPSALSW